MSRFAIAAVTALLLTAASTASADVQLTIKNGRVTLIARDATVRQILTEWARLGQVKIVNVDRIPGGPVTLELQDVTEQQALRILLRSVGGYIAAPRATVASDIPVSVFDRIVVMPVAAQAPTNAPAAAAPPPPAFAFQPPQQFPIEDDRDEPSPQPQPANRTPVFVFPQPPGSAPQPQQMPANGQPPTQPSGPARPNVGAFPGAPTGSAPVGTAVPGMMVPAPPQLQPGLPAQPGAPQFQPAQPFQQAPAR
jgi:hypothetical protein